MYTKNINNKSRNESTNNFSWTHTSFTLHLYNCFYLKMLCNRRHLRLILCKHLYGIFSAKIHLRLLAGKTSLYLRFIDVIILKQTKAGKNLVNFLNDRNTKHASIKFAFNYSTEKIRCCSNTRMVTFRPHFTEIWLITKILALNIQTSLGTKKECSLQSGAIRKRYLLNSN